MILFSSELELTKNNKFKMNKLIIDATGDKIFLMVINDDPSQKITHENSKFNYEKLTLLLNDFLKSINLDLIKISKIYVNRGPGSFAGIRNSLSVVKAIHLINKIDYYCFSLNDFGLKNGFKYENLPQLCEKFNIKKNLINPIYMS